MIPKIIHYCWFGGKKKPQEIDNYINTWQKICPDYIIKEWNENNFDINYNKYVFEAYNAKKYAFVSDVCRMYALYNDGGIYLDTDVEVLKSFNSYLNNESFIGEEQKGLLLGTAVIGSEPKIQWIKDFLSLYDGISFVQHNGMFDILPNTSRLTKFLKTYQDSRPNVYPVDYFCAKDYKSGEVEITKNTVCIHHYAASWVEPLRIQKMEAKFWNLLGINYSLNISGKIYWRIIKPLKVFNL